MGLVLGARRARRTSAEAAEQPAGCSMGATERIGKAVASAGGGSGAGPGPGGGGSGACTSAAAARAEAVKARR